ncbi:MAG: hypothetical protein QOJ51_5184 [Acidobacteriaceae bacterium]|nr:hypothetical protein [Acidobacteriaceae bacterium]
MRLIVSSIVVEQELIDHRDVLIGFFVVGQMTAFFEPDELRSGDGMGHCPGDVGGHVQIEAALDHKRREWKCAICGVRSRLARLSRQLRQWPRRSQGREHWRGIGRKALGSRKLCGNGRGDRDQRSPRRSWPGHVVCRPVLCLRDEMGKNLFQARMEPGKAWCGGVRQDESVDVLRVRDRVSGGEQAPHRNRQ